jgi:hypothetical protein
MNPDLDGLIRREFGLGAAEHPQSIYHCRDPRLPQFEFEFHVAAQRVYRIDLPGEWKDGAWVPAPPGAQAHGRCVAEHCLTHAMFLGFVQTFCRGYLLALAHHAQGTLQALVPDRVLQTDPCPVR